MSEIIENNGSNPGDINLTNINSPQGHAVRFRIHLSSGEQSDPTGCLLVGSTGGLTQWAIGKDNVVCNIFGQDCANPQEWIKLNGSDFLYQKQYFYNFNCDFTNGKIVSFQGVHTE